MNPPECLLKISGIDKTFPGVKALTQAGLSVYAGQAMALIGENGAGKSTLMKVLTGIYTKDAGSIEYLGREVAFRNPRESQQAGISIIHQELNLIGELSIAENIFLGREPLTRFGIDWKKLYRDADALLARLSFPFASDTPVRELSVGEQQMVEIAKALSFESRVIIMDEPTDALTDRETQTLFRIINELKAEGRGIVYISHRLHELFEICERITVLRDGAFIAEVASADCDEARLIELMVGRSLDEQYPHLARAPGVALLDVERYTSHGLRDISFTLHAGEILGIFGLMGAGRTELAKMLYGALQPQGGELRLAGRTIHNRSPKEALENGIAYVSEDRKAEGLILGMSVRDNASLSALPSFSRHGHIQAARERDSVAQYVGKMRVRTPSLAQSVGLLSGGNQQKIAIAKGLMTCPRVLILDEPTRGVDVGAKKEIYQLINELKAEGMGIIMISSDMPEILGMSDRILAIKGGEITGIFRRGSVSQEALLTAAIAETPTHEPA